MLVIKSYLNNITPEVYDRMINPPAISISLKALKRSLNANLYEPLDDLKDLIAELQ